MKRCITLALSATALLSVTSFAALAQTAPPTFQADPEVYKVIFEDQNFRVIAATWPKGLHDKAHSHPGPSIVYSLTDCVIRLHAPDGTTRDFNNKAGAAQAAPMTPSHTAENVGPGKCRLLFVERK
jgi:hypothetical protein